ncbi:TVP38/TMEM64 family protein [Nocardia thailandica]
MARLFRNPRILAILAAVAALFAVAAVMPLPSPEAIRNWAGASGPLLPVLFFLFYAVVAVAPVPRTVLTVTSGILFGPLLGGSLALGASAVAAMLALGGVRALGRERVAPHLTHPAVRAVNERLARRGWLAVASLRMIPVAPFPVVNYCCGLSSVRPLPYLAATVLGSAPGTFGTVTLVGSLTADTDPAMLLVSGGCFALGIVGLIIDARWPVPETAAREPADSPATV